MNYSCNTITTHRNSPPTKQLTQLHRIRVATRRHEMQCLLAVVRCARLVHVGAGQQQQPGAALVPQHLHGVRLEVALERHRLGGLQIGILEDLALRRIALDAGHTERHERLLRIRCHRQRAVAIVAGPSALLGQAHSAGGLVEDRLAAHHQRHNGLVLRPGRLPAALLLLDGSELFLAGVGIVDEQIVGAVRAIFAGGERLVRHQVVAVRRELEEAGLGSRECLRNAPVGRRADVDTGHLGDYIRYKGHPNISETLSLYLHLAIGPGEVSAVWTKDGSPAEFAGFPDELGMQSVWHFQAGRTVQVQAGI